MAVDSLRLAGDPRAEAAGRRITELFEAHGRMVYGLCSTLLRDRNDADDATQATFVSAYKSLLGGREVREPAAWLATIARNECGARAHARMREPLPLPDVGLAHIQGPESELERKALVEELQQAIAELPEKQREAVVLRDLYGLQYAEVGAALGMSVASVESLLFRARRTLRISLRPLAGTAVAVPIVVRESIAQALPLFGGAGGGTGAAAGLGLLAKLSGGPVVAKVAAGLAAVAAVGSVAVVRTDHPTPGPKATVSAAAVPRSGTLGRNAPSDNSIPGLRPASGESVASRSVVLETGNTRASPPSEQDGSSNPGGPRGDGAASDTAADRGDATIGDGGRSSRLTPVASLGDHTGSNSGSGDGGEQSQAPLDRANEIVLTMSGSKDSSSPDEGDPSAGSATSAGGGSDSGSSNGSGNSSQESSGADGGSGFTDGSP